MGQTDTGAGLRLGLFEPLQQIFGERGGQLRVAFGFLGVERQLQHAAIVPVGAALQGFKQASGVTETADDQLRQRGAMG